MSNMAAEGRETIHRLTESEFKNRLAGAYDLGRYDEIVNANSIRQWWVEGGPESSTPAPSRRTNPYRQGEPEPEPLPDIRDSEPHYCPDHPSADVPMRRLAQAMNHWVWTCTDPSCTHVEIDS